MNEARRSRRNRFIGTLVRFSGTIVSLVGFFLPIIVFFLGRGVANQPRLIITQSQLSLNSTTFSNCIVNNEGRTNAEDVLIRIESEGEPFNGLEVIGAEDDWTIESGGISHPEVSVRVPRLVSTYGITITVSTDTPINFICDAASDMGPGSPPPESPITFNWGDVLILISINALVITVSWILHSSYVEQHFERNNAKLESLHQELKQEILKKIKEDHTRGAQENEQES